MSKIQPGKARRRERAAHLAPVREAPTQQQAQKATNYQQDLLARIDSSAADERQWAIDSISRLVVEEPQIFALVVEKSDVIQRLVKRIFDSETYVRVAASGVIRNLTAVGDLDVCRKVIASDCLTSLFAVLRQFQLPTELKPKPQKTDEQDDEDLEDAEETEKTENADSQELVINSLAILSNLSEFDNYVLEKIVESGIVGETLFQFLRPLPHITKDLSIAAAELLHVLTDEQYAPVINQITEDSSLLLKATLANVKGDSYLRVLSAGVLFNIYTNRDIQGWDSILIKLVIPTLVQTLDFDASQYFVSILQLAPTEYPLSALQSGTYDPQIVYDLKQWKLSMTSQITALEILANLTLIGNDEDEGAKGKPKSKLTAAIHQQLQATGAFGKILIKCETMTVPTNIPNLPNGQQVIKQLEQMPVLIPYLRLFYHRQSRALSALNNLLLCLELNVLISSVGDLQPLWNQLFHLCGHLFTLTPSAAPETPAPPAITPSTNPSLLLSSLDSGPLLTQHTIEELQVTVTSILYALVRSMVGSNTTKAIALEGWSVEGLFKMTAHPSLEHVRANSIGMLGLFVKSGLIAAPALIDEFGAVVVKGLSDNSGWVIVEALDVVFSVFDDNFPETVEKVKLLPTLQTFLPFLARKLKDGQGQIDPELYEKLDEALVNIEPFLQYKKQQQKGRF